MKKYIELPVKDSEDVYYIQMLNVRDIRQVVTKCMSLLAPVLGDGIDTYQEFEKERVMAYVSSDEESVEDIQEPDMKLFSVFTVLGSQLDNPLVEEIQDLLLKGAKFSTKGKVDNTKIENLPDYSLDEVHGAEAFKQYLKVLKVAFEQNAYHPFVECLNEVGYSQIVGKVQAVINSKIVNPT